MPFYFLICFRSYLTCCTADVHEGVEGRPRARDLDFEELFWASSRRFEDYYDSDGSGNRRGDGGEPAAGVLFISHAK